MSTPPRRWKCLSRQISLVYASLSVTLVVLLCYIAYQMSARILEERIRQELLQTVDQALRGINAELDERMREVHAMTLTPVVRRASTAGARHTERLGLQSAAEEPVSTSLSGWIDSVERRDAEQYLTDLKDNHADLAEVIVTDRYGINAAASNPTTDSRQEDETWWREAFQGKHYLGNLDFDQSAASYSYSIALPIPDDPRPPLGAVKAVFNFKAVQDLVNSIHVGNMGYLVVVANDGLILSHPEERYRFRTIREVPELVAVAHTITSSRGVTDLGQRDENAIANQWLLAHAQLLRPANLGPLNWTVAALISRDEVVTPIIAVRNRAISAGLIFILAAVPIVSAVSRRLSRPLVDLAHRANRISQGELDVSLGVAARNEIGSLAAALASMVETLKASHRRTLEINARLERTVRERTDELQRKNRQIEAQNRKVMEANRLKSQLLANMSHELRTPLGAVIALSEIMTNETSGPLNEEQLKQITTINRSGKSLLRLINDVLDLSKIEAGRMSVDKAPMSLHGLISLVADTLRPLAEDKNLSLATTIAPGLPEFIGSDEHKLRQILINLVGNAIKFTERGGVRIEAIFTADPPVIEFKVVDSGIGIAPESIERIFEEFHQADGSTTRRHGGTGLGLTISKRMAELIGGTLTAESTIGQGSTFTFSIPYEAAPPVPASPTETLRRVRMQVPEAALMSTTDDSASLSEGRPIVLVAEDEQDNLYIMKKYLNRAGCQVVFARDGNEVVLKARKYRPIAITLDLVLPKKNGWDVLSDLKSSPDTRHIPVIIASVLDNQERGYCLGAYRYLVKPISETDLADTVYQIQAAARRDTHRILIIDDNLVDSDLAARLLTENRYEVLRASTGDEGIATALRERPDLIMLDLGLPDMDGFQVLDALKRVIETRDIPVVIYTARDLGTEDKERVRVEARSVFLKNPLEPRRMLAEIADALRTQPTGSRTANSDGASLESSSASVGQSVARHRDVSKRVLIVEDDPANQYTLELLLRMEGYDIEIAANGRDAIEKAARLQPDVILMDMMMPVMGGHEATRVLKEMPRAKRIPIIALTAAAMAGDREKALASGCDDYVSKPVSREHLVERIEHWTVRTRTSSDLDPPRKSASGAAGPRSLLHDPLPNSSRTE